MAEWIYFLHPPRENFAATMTAAEHAVWSDHFELIKQRYDDGQIILVGPTLGEKNTGVCVFEAEDEAAATAFMASDPAITSGIASGELRPFRVSLLRGRTTD